MADNLIRKKIKPLINTPNFDSNTQRNCKYHGYPILKYREKTLPIAVAVSLFLDFSLITISSLSITVGKNDS